MRSIDFAPIIDKPSKEDLKQLITPVSDQELEFTPEMQNKIDELVEYFNQYGINYDDLMSVPGESKKAYPNYDMFSRTPAPRDLNKWLMAVKNIYYGEKQGLDRKEAIKQATGSWGSVEQFDFLSWLKFYEEGANLKYKIAQNWLSGSYVLPKPTQPAFTGHEIADTKEMVNNTLSNQSKREIIERQRYKIISRLDSAEKMLRSSEGNIFAGVEFENLIEKIYDLKKRIALVNKISVSNSLYEDMIIRSANMMRRQGFVKGAEFLTSIAETDKLPTPVSPSPPSLPSGNVGDLPAKGPGMPNPDSGGMGYGNDNSPMPAGISQFLDGMDTGNVTTPEDEDKHDLEINDSEDDLVVEAQTAPVVTPEEPKPSLPTAPLEVSEPQNTASLPPAKDIKDIDAVLDAAFSNITVQDVVVKLEQVVSIFKRRDLSRELSMIDIMLNSLNMAGLFQNLSEAINKSYESNSYISSRLDDVLSKLRSAIDNSDGSNLLDVEEGVAATPASNIIKEKVQQQLDKDKERKQIKRKQEEEQLVAPKKETPEINMEEGLAPTPATPPPPIPVAPAG